MIVELHELLPVGEVRAEPAGSTAVDAELAFETFDEDVMVDGVECCRHGGLLLIGSRVHTVHDVE